MGSSKEDPNKGIDTSVGGLVWVRRRNGSWWPGKILGLDELPEGFVGTPRSGTPVQLLGKEDSSVDWYNLEKSKRVKAFHCREYNQCIEKVRASASQPSKKSPKYAKRDDAILHALEIESARLVKDHQNLSDTHNIEPLHDDELPSEVSSTEESESETESEDSDENSNSSEDDSDLAHEIYQSGVSFEECDKFRALNDSEEDGVKRTRGLEDLGMNVALSLKRKRSQIPHNQELLLKRKNRRRTLTKVLECTTMVSVPVGEQLSSPTGSSMLVASDNMVSGFKTNNSDSNGVPCMLLNASKHENEISENDSFGRLFDVPLVAEEKHSAGLSSFNPDALHQAHLGARTHSSQSSHVETSSLGIEENNESGSTSSGSANIHKIEKGTSEWRLKGKRNSRSRKADALDEAQEYVPSAYREVGPTHPQRLLPYRQSRCTVNPKYDSSDFSLRHHTANSALYDVPLDVKTTYGPHHVPYISLTSKLTGCPVVGHPLVVEALDDGSCGELIGVSECYYSTSEAEYNVSEDKQTRVRPPHKRHARGSSFLKKSRKKNGILSKKTRKLSSLTGSMRLGRDERKSVFVEKLNKGPSVACVPLNVVFSRINADLSGFVRPAPRLIATSGM